MTDAAPVPVNQMLKPLESTAHMLNARRMMREKL
jgi:hypothetical protein